MAESRSDSWWLLNSKELKADPLARHNRQVAYYNVLYGTDEGRLVLNDIRELCYAGGNLELIALYDIIRNIAGRTSKTELAMIVAEAESIEFATVEEIQEKGIDNADYVK